MREIGETRSILETRIRQWMTGTAEQICVEFTRKMCLVLRSEDFEYQGQKSKVNVTRDKNALCSHNVTPAVCTEWNALVADNVAQAADATIRSLQRGVFVGMRALGLAGYRWALPRISSISNAKLAVTFQNLFHGIFRITFLHSQNFVFHADRLKQKKIKLQHGDAICKMQN